MRHSVVLVNPPLTLEERYGKDMKHFGAVSEPLGIAYVAGYLESKQIPVRIVDAPAEGMAMDGVVGNIGCHNDTLVGITMLTPGFGVVKNLCARLKKKYPDIVIVLGGPHCTALPERTLDEIPDADIVCFGEGEITMAKIAQNRDAGYYPGIQGICYRHKEKTVKNDPRPFIKELDFIPQPARHLLPMGKYHLTASRVSGSSFCPTIIVARGCPFACTYCSHTFGKKLRTHSIQRILSEIRSLIEMYDIDQLNIEADTLTANKKFLKALCDGLIESGISKRVKWTCESRVDTVDPETLTLMQRAGCWQISYGVETGSSRLLKQINKSVTLEQVEAAFEDTKRAGISIRGFFMLGLPTETRAESMATINFARKLDPLWAQFTITIPYPGTPMFEDLDSMGMIRTYDWSKYNTWSGWKDEDEIPFVSEGRTIKELVGLQKQALRRFYLRPVVFLRFFATIHSFHDLKKYAMGFWILVKSRF